MRKRMFQKAPAAFSVLCRAHYCEYAPRAKGPAALPVERHVLACLGWVGQTTDLFEHLLVPLGTGLSV